MTDFILYLNNIKEQLYCNADNEYKKNYITYMYSNKEIDDNIEYFKKSMKIGLSPYKALLFFNDYLNGEYFPI